MRLSRRDSCCYTVDHDDTYEDNDANDAVDDYADDDYADDDNADDDNADDDYADDIQAHRGDRGCADADVKPFRLQLRKRLRELALGVAG